MGDDVVGDRGCGHPLTLHALDAQRVSLEISLRSDSPLAVVAASGRVPPPPVVLALLLFPVEIASACISQGRAARIAAGTLWRKGAHAAFLFS